jgi:hypothetical protein
MWRQWEFRLFKALYINHIVYIITPTESCFELLACYLLLLHDRDQV